MTNDELNKIVDKVVDRIVDKKFNDSFINEKISKKLSEDTRLTLIGLLEDSYRDIIDEITNLVLSNIDELLLYKVSNSSSFRHELSRLISMDLDRMNGEVKGAMGIINNKIHQLEYEINNIKINHLNKF